MSSWALRAPMYDVLIGYEVLSGNDVMGPDISTCDYSGMD